MKRLFVVAATYRDFENWLKDQNPQPEAVRWLRSSVMVQGMTPKSAELVKLPSWDKHPEAADIERISREKGLW